MDRFNELEKSWERRQKIRQTVLGLIVVIIAAAFAFNQFAKTPPESTPQPQREVPVQKSLPAEPTPAASVTAPAEKSLPPQPAPEKELPAMRLVLDRSFDTLVRRELEAAARQSQTVSEKQHEQEMPPEALDAEGSQPSITSESIDGTEKVSLLIENFHLEESYGNALKVARFYFEAKAFQKAVEWSLKANQIDSADDESWLLFAQASLALGDKKQAENALGTYLQKRDSLQVRRLYNQLREEP